MKFFRHRTQNTKPPKGLSNLFDEYDIVIDRKTGKVIKSTPIDPERCAQFLAPFIVKMQRRIDECEPGSRTKLQLTARD